MKRSRNTRRDKHVKDGLPKCSGDHATTAVSKSSASEVLQLCLAFLLILEHMRRALVLMVCRVSACQTPLCHVRYLASGEARDTTQ